MTRPSIEKARKRVKELKTFYVHLITYIAVNIMLLIINITTSPDHWWFIYPLFGWGIGITVHFLTTFILRSWSSHWEEKKIKELLTKDNK